MLVSIKDDCSIAFDGINVVYLPAGQHDLPDGQCKRLIELGFATVYKEAVVTKPISTKLKSEQSSAKKAKK